MKAYLSSSERTEDKTGCGFFLLFFNLFITIDTSNFAVSDLDDRPSVLVWKLFSQRSVGDTDVSLRNEDLLLSGSEVKTPNGELEKKEVFDASRRTRERLRRPYFEEWVERFFETRVKISAAKCRNSARCSDNDGILTTNTYTYTPWYAHQLYLSPSANSLLQSNVLRPYLAAVRSTLTAALTLEDFSSQVRSYP